MNGSSNVLESPVSCLVLSWPVHRSLLVPSAVLDPVLSYLVWSLAIMQLMDVCLVYCFFKKKHQCTIQRGLVDNAPFKQLTQA